jgi:hypothetical protein
VHTYTHKTKKRPEGRFFIVLGGAGGYLKLFSPRILGYHADRQSINTHDTKISDRPTSYHTISK